VVFEIAYEVDKMGHLNYEVLNHYCSIEVLSLYNRIWYRAKPQADLIG
jgi:hypothetical protein